MVLTTEERETLNDRVHNLFQRISRIRVPGVYRIAQSESLLLYHPHGKDGFGNPSHAKDGIEYGIEFDLEQDTQNPFCTEQITIRRYGRTYLISVDTPSRIVTHVDKLPNDGVP
ncbi:hypothetical protein HZA99_05640 [Candidatus Woesearchaeota archaeon]|nr:hypothetical protein [Candidatus Woesearchaeota archaeon]